MDFINFRPPLIGLDRQHIRLLWRECTPKVLVVTDNLNYLADDDFGLSQFVQTLRSAKVHGMTPIVVTASRSGDASADIAGFNFNDASNGLLKSRYDVVFLFGAASEGFGALPAAEVEAIARFMEAGGGVFATGDHETLGAAMCGDVPRVRAMRRWKGASAPPSATSTNRLSTNLSGPNEGEEFSDQSNNQPQRLYVNFRTQAGGIGQPHPILQLKGPRRVLEVFPDHPHEGQCQVPASLGTSFTLDGKATPEWPNDVGGGALSPEVVAMSVSHGDGFGPKQALMPQLFPAMVAYDGHRANRGRVSTDSTWHHFININLDGTDESDMSKPPAERVGLRHWPSLTDSEALVRIREHFVNLATWLMPKNVRKCLRFPLVLSEMVRYPLFEELEIRPLKDATAPQLRELGEALMTSIRLRGLAWEARALMEDALEDAVGERAARDLLDQEEEDGLAAKQAMDVAHAALGGLLTGVATRLQEIKDLREVQPHETFEGVALEGARIGAKLALAERRQKLRLVDEFLSRFEGSLR